MPKYVSSSSGCSIQPEAAPHDPLEVPGEEIGQVERADLFLLERFERRRAGIELVAMGAGDAFDALEVVLEHPVEQATRAAVGVRHEDPVVVAATCAKSCGDRVGNALGAVVQVGGETGQVDPGQAPRQRHELAPERTTTDDEDAPAQERRQAAARLASISLRAVSAATPASRQ